MSPADALRALLSRRILVLDGAMGTMIQGLGLDEAAFRGEAFGEHARDLAGCNDLLSLTQPEAIEAIHRAYLEAGADMVETNTFNATAPSLADYGLEDAVFAINKAAAEVAARAAEVVSSQTPDRPRFVAGSIGPTSKTTSLSPDVNDPAFRAIDFEGLERAYYEQVRGLIAGGVDILLAETSFDTLNLKAALFAIQRYFHEHGVCVPVMASFTITDASGRTLSGQTTEAAWISLSHVDLLGVGINCALGAQEMRPYIEELAGLAHVHVSCHPNAGLPNEFGAYDQTPEQMAAILGEFAREGWLNIVGGCCGTTPEHIRALAETVSAIPPRRPAKRTSLTCLSGMEPLSIRPESNFIMVGERTNVTGSRRFARLIREERFETALEVARDQVEGGANILDVNMDEGLLDSEAAMTRFLNLVASEPEVARLPIMIDSSKFSVLEAGLRCLQGKGVVNSISLKEGEEEFKRQARLIKRYGAALIVMAFDEEGQAVTLERKVGILSRAHRILTEEIGFDDSDVIFDPNILTVATGIEEHNPYAVAFIEAARELKRRFPRSKISGGISNISFSFRGNELVRQAMHAAFLYHAIRAGMDMGIVNAGQLAVYDEIAPDLLQAVEDVLLDRGSEATERLIELAARATGSTKTRRRDDTWRRGSIEERLSHALIHGVSEHLESDLTEALERFAGPLAIIEGPLMSGMNIVGDRFGSGKMFLPQVVKSARVMKRAVAYLEPLMDQQKQGSHGLRKRILLATVKGDVHDIGKNIVGVVLACNGYEIIDLGVMVPAERILETAGERRVDLVGLSGLITPSLEEMAHVAREMDRVGLEVPLLIGGATTSRRHTAVKIAPAYRHATVYVSDASRAVEVARTLIAPAQRLAFAERNRAEQQAARDSFTDRAKGKLLRYDEALADRLALDWSGEAPPRPAFLGTRVVDDLALSELVPYIDWTPFFHVWELRGVYPRILEDPKYGESAREVFDHARQLLERIVEQRLLQARGVYGFFGANSEGDDILLFADEARQDPLARLHTLRQQRAASKDSPRLALADFVAPRSSGVADFVGAFAVTTGLGADPLVAEFERDDDDYNAILVKALADRLAEAFAELLHERARRDWGYGRQERLSKEELIRERYVGIRPAPGYPACPDHSEKRTIFSLLDVEQTAGIRLTDSCAMLPAASVSGLYLAHPQSRYFAVGRIGRDQAEAYARRKQIEIGEVERWLWPYLDYEPRG